MLYGHRRQKSMFPSVLSVHGVLTTGEIGLGSMLSTAIKGGKCVNRFRYVVPMPGTKYLNKAFVSRIGFNFIFITHKKCNTQ